MCVRLTLGGKVTNCSSHDTKNDRGPWSDETGGWSSSDETRDTSGTPSDHGPLAGESPIKKNPGDGTKHGSQVGVPASHGSTHVGTESRSTVEAQPTEPEEDGSESNKRNVVWTEVQHHLLLTAAENHGVCKSGQTGSNFDRSSTSVVVDTPLESPSVDVPNPASDWAVDDGGPEEDKDHHWNQTTTLSDSADDDSSGGSTELHLMILVSIQ